MRVFVATTPSSILCPHPLAPIPRKIPKRHNYSLKEKEKKEHQFHHHETRMVGLIFCFFLVFVLFSAHFTRLSRMPSAVIFFENYYICLLDLSFCFTFTSSPAIMFAVYSIFAPTLIQPFLLTFSHPLQTWKI